VTLLRTPNGGIQPQAARDNKGVVHLIYYKGDPAGGDIFYTRQLPGDINFSKPLQVNSQPGTAIALGTIRGAQLALGKSNRVHVVWNGADAAKRNVRSSIGGKEITPLLYTRLNDSATAFEPERNLITYAAGLDGGSSVAADRQGNVYVTWHAPVPGNTNGEAGRAIFVACSHDDGQTFQREAPALDQATGACPCCGMRAFADDSGAVYILFRAANEHVNRDETLLLSPKPGAPFQIATTHKWKANTCPMSSASLSPGLVGTLAAWETGEKIYFATVNPKTLEVSEPVSPPGTAVRKHPVAIANRAGQTLLVWTEGTGWAKGGAVGWQLYDANGEPTSQKGRAEGLPTWSLATAYSKPDGNFVIIF
jgi:hypothetical protein